MCEIDNKQHDVTLQLAIIIKGEHFGRLRHGTLKSCVQQKSVKLYAIEVLQPCAINGFCITYLREWFH